MSINVWKNLDLKSKYITVVFALCLIIFILTVFGERSDFFNGIGSDGLSISHFATNLLNCLENKDYFSEAGTRLLPMLITHICYSLVTFFRPDEFSVILFDDFKINVSENIVLTCQILNLFYLCSSVIIFSFIVYKRNFSFRAFLLCNGLFYLNFMFLKQFFFEPVSFDTFYLFYSALLLLSIHSRLKWLQYLLLFLSVFVSSLAIVFTAVILFSSNKSNWEIKFSRKFVMFSFFILYLVISVYLLLSPLCTEITENKTIHSLSSISIISTLLYLFIIFMLLIPKKFNLRFSKNSWLYFVFILSIIGFKLIVFLFTLKANLEICEGLDEAALNKIINNIRQVNSRPFGFLSSHFDYLGLFIIFVFIFSKSIKNFLSFNQKYIPLIILFIFCTLTSESRYLTTFLPFIFLILFDQHELCSERIKICLSTKWITGIIIFNLIWSGFYLKINPLDTNIYYKLISSNSNLNLIFSYPFQKYFKHLGPWTSNDSYIWQLSVFFVILFYFLVYFKFHSYNNSKENKDNLR